jgi:hypothetical protein
MVAGILANIRTGRLPATSLEHCRYTNPFRASMLCRQHREIYSYCAGNTLRSLFLLCRQHIAKFILIVPGNILRSFYWLYRQLIANYFLVFASQKEDKRC